jgi:hypothetical protein
MTIGDLRAQLAKLESSHEAVVVLNGTLSPIIEVLAVPGAEFIVIRGKGTAPPPRKFTVSEEGVIGHLVRLGFGDEKIGEVLGRAPKSIAQKRKALGI